MTGNRKKKGGIENGTARVLERPYSDATSMSMENDLDGFGNVSYDLNAVNIHNAKMIDLTLCFAVHLALKTPPVLISKIVTCDLW